MRHAHLSATLLASAITLIAPLSVIADTTSLPPSIATSSLDVATILKVQNLWAQVQQLMSQINALVQPSATSTSSTATSTPPSPATTTPSSTVIPPSASIIPNAPSTPPPPPPNTRSIAEALRAVITQVAHETQNSDIFNQLNTTQTNSLSSSNGSAVFTIPSDATDQSTSAVQDQILQITMTLKRGMSGDSVRLLQEILATDSDIFASADISGTFGPKTEAAVKLLQQHFGIDATGIVGPQTRTKINDLLIQNNIMSATDLQDSVLGDLGTGTSVQDQSGGDTTGN